MKQISVELLRVDLGVGFDKSDVWTLLPFVKLLQLKSWGIYVHKSINS
jgi:hypothetical protein